ncbi:MAG: DUF1285 domain-containing protein [Oceanospirillaceae bacterium]|nr:DUF1285 domain-containing protein [Oceanospirillaceae bacterium]
MPTTFDFEKIINSVEQGSPPPLHLWHPALSGDIDISIDTQGVWRHCGDVFKRTAIPRMFARILCREGDQYFLKTPHEKWRIKVADVPFYFIHLEQVPEGQDTQLRFVSITEDVVILDQADKLRVSVNEITGEPSHYLQVRDNMEGKISRNLYYQLVALAIDDAAAQKLYLQSGEHSVYFGSY